MQRDKFLHLVAIEPAQVQLGIGVAAVQAVQQGRQRVVVGQILAAIRDHQEERCVAQPLGQPAQDRQRVGVCPVQVVKKYRQRALVSQRDKEGHDGVDEAQPVFLGCAPQVRGRHVDAAQAILQAGDDLHQLAKRRRRQAAHDQVGQSIEIAAQAVGERGKRQVAFQHLAGRADDGGAALPGLPQHLVGQACLADPRLAFQQQQGPAPFDNLMQPLFDKVQLCLAPHKDARIIGVEHRQQGALRQHDRLVGDLGQCAFDVDGRRKPHRRSKCGPGAARLRR